MASYRVYEHPTQGVQLVPDGFSWTVLALCSVGLGCVYFAFKRLWLLAIIWLLLDDIASAIGVLGVFAGNATPAYLIGLFHLAFMSLVPAVKANDWIAAGLESREFAFKGRVEGPTPAAALANYSPSMDSQDSVTTTADMPQSIRAEVVLHQGGSIKRIPINKDTMIIGRKSDCDIVIDEPYISGRHAKIEWRSNHFFLTDIASTNGTLLNGKPISSETWISETDSVQLGEVTLRIAEQR